MLKLFNCKSDCKLICINNFAFLSKEQKLEIESFLSKIGIKKCERKMIGNSLAIPKFIKNQKVTPLLGMFLKDIEYLETKVKTNPRVKSEKDIIFSEIESKAKKFAEFLINDKEKIAKILQEYECYNVAIDEIERSIDHLLKFKSNKRVFYKKSRYKSFIFPSIESITLCNCLFWSSAIVCL